MQHAGPPELQCRCLPSQYPAAFPTTGGQTHYGRTNEAHAVKDGGVEHERHGVRVQRLPAEGPHEWAVCEVERRRHDGRAGPVLLQDFLRAAQRTLSHVFNNLSSSCDGAQACLSINKSKSTAFWEIFFQAKVRIMLR